MSSIDSNRIQDMVSRAISAHQLGRLSEAEALYKSVLGIEPDQFESLHFLGLIEAQRGNFKEADRLMARSLQINSGRAEAYANHARVLNSLKRSHDALASCDKALQLQPGLLPALISRGNALLDLRRGEEALESYDLVLKVQPGLPDNWVNRGNALDSLERYAEALTCFDRALAANANHSKAWSNRGVTLLNLSRAEEALASFDRALAIDPGLVDALYDRAEALKRLQRLEDALVCYEEARAISPGHQNAPGVLDVVLALCDWRRTEGVAAEVVGWVRREDGPILPPFPLLSISDDPELHFQGARKFVRDSMPVPPPPLWNGARFSHDKIRLAYLSADFHEHPVAHLTAELFGRHDRSRFEVSAISFGPDDGSPIRKRLEDAFDHFVDVRGRGAREIAELLHSREVDFAVDLGGYTFEARPKILAFRPAPIQVNYLGYPGTLAAAHIDYVIADPVVLPFDQQPFYSERIVHLPDCFQPYDTQRKVAEPTPSRREAGLPESGFVFCCFNNNFKITEPVFSVWIRLLRQIDESVLWLRRYNAGAEANLRREARARGVDPARLVFAGRCDSLEEHLARHRCADLFLDTLPYNAHTTASDALWAGLPLVTCKGKAFAGRVAASLLQAVGLPELVTETLADYEALALRLASDPALLAEIRTKLARGRQTQPLFNIDRFRRHIESAYATMWEIWQRGEAPRSFRVAALGGPAR